MEDFIYQPEFTKNGKKIRKLSLLYINPEPQLCDCCDEEKVCSSVNTLGNDVFIICKDCLQLIIDEF